MVILYSLLAEITAWINRPGQAAETRPVKLGYCRSILLSFYSSISMYYLLANLDCFGPLVSNNRTWPGHLLHA